MKKIVFSFICMAIISSTAFAQPSFSDLRVDIGGNYTMYKGDFQKSTPGAKIRFSLPLDERFVIGLGFTYGFPIKTPSEVEMSGGGTVPSEFSTNFKTFTLEGDYYFGGEKEEGFSVYAGGRAGLVLASVKEKIKGSVPAGQEPLDLYGSSRQSGFTINLAVGSQYSLGGAKIFADAGVALPANQVNGEYVENVIPAHFTFNVGVRFSFGGSSDY